MAYVIEYPYEENKEYIYILEGDEDGYRFEYIHILQNVPTKEQLEIIGEKYPEIVVVYLEKLDVFALGVNTCLSDKTSDIESCYKIIDGTIPVTNVD